MSYIRGIDEDPGALGCGSQCACARCRQSAAGFGERYVEADDDEEPPPPKAKARPPRAMPVRANPALGEPPAAPVAAPTTVIDRFDFGKATVLPIHQPQIIAIARSIIASHGTTAPVRQLRLIGHTDPRGTEAYNVELGMRRAQEVRKHLLAALARMQPRIPWPNRVVIDVESRGERQPFPGGPERSRRVEVFLPSSAPPPPPPPRPIPPPAPRPTVCPPPTCSPAGSIIPSRHGFKFPNSFTVTIPLPPPFPSIPASFGLCGGMATAALDYFLSCIPIPSTTAIPTSGTPLFNYLLRRQLDSLGAPLFGMVPKFLTWTNLPDTTPGGALPILVPAAGLISGLQELTVPEFHATVASLTAGRPVVLGLVYVGPGAVSIWHNHQVLAFGAAPVSSTVTNIKVYDPNDPGNDGVIIRCELIAGGRRVRCLQMWPGGRTKTLRGFFRMPYARVVPPCLP
jgi:outer membrane protein OmpA-like peptidoglycan-associated protein